MMKVISLIQEQLYLSFPVSSDGQILYDWYCNSLQMIGIALSCFNTKNFYQHLNYFSVIPLSRLLMKQMIITNSEMFVSYESDIYEDCWKYYFHLTVMIKILLKCFQLSYNIYKYIINTLCIFFLISIILLLFDIFSGFFQ